MSYWNHLSILSRNILTVGIFVIIGADNIMIPTSSQSLAQYLENFLRRFTGIIKCSAVSEAIRSEVHLDNSFTNLDTSNYLAKHVFLTTDCM